jgi:RHH-type proline utilization regulon transcriptional repressor/proline dehydrogenase/delta 1-pyrroline-5-carboxylate dehydrogenase
LLDKLAELLNRDRYQLIALEILEAGKQWEEADGDIAEAIDFCRYYAREMRRLAQPRRVGRAPGEVSLYQYRPRGVSVVIAPWNFPLAILCGMVAGSVVTGNTCVMKPAEQTCVIGAFLMRAIKEAGFPDGVVNFLSGYGEEIGPVLVKSKATAQICFTGSKAVGLSIIESAGRTLEGQENVKRVMCEMGGKNAIIVDSDADLDEAVAGVLYSAFGFQGQKCSAASRVVVVEEIYERFAQRLLEAARSMPALASDEPDSFIGPVIDQEARDRILAAIEAGKAEALVGFQGAVPQEGWFVPPTIFIDVPASARVAQEEIFGPVLAVIRARDIDEALAIANNVEYALTGGIYSRSPANIEKAKQALEVGNLYVNRGITGAMVERHPFGGFKMSGLGSKTGGPDYLIQFMDPQVITENTLRRGFAPAEEGA